MCLTLPYEFLNHSSDCGKVLVSCYTTATLERFLRGGSGVGFFLHFLRVHIKFIFNVRDKVIQYLPYKTMSLVYLHLVRSRSTHMRNEKQK